MKYVLALIMVCSPLFASAHEEGSNEAKPDQVEPMDQSQKKMDAQLGKNKVGPTPTNKKAKKPFSSKEEKEKDDKKSAY